MTRARALTRAGVVLVALARAPMRALVMTAALAASGCGTAPPGGPTPGWRERVMVEVPRIGGEPCLVEKPDGYDARNWIHDFAAWAWQCAALGRVTAKPGTDA